MDLKANSFLQNTERSLLGRCHKLKYQTIMQYYYQTFAPQKYVHSHFKLIKIINFGDSICSEANYYPFMYFCSTHLGKQRNSLVAQWVRDPALSLLWQGLIPGLGISMCHGYFVNYSFYLLFFSLGRTASVEANLLCFFFLSSLFFFFFCFLGLNLWHMKVPRLGVESELQLPATVTATAMPDPMHL